MESICERENMQRALRQVLKNDGAPGIDKVDVRQMARYYRRHREKITSSLLDGRYRPNPVRLKEIPKPEGGKRRLGIPVTLDRLIAQAMTQQLVALWDHTFSEYSFGFRPERSQHDAIRHVQELIKQGYRFCVSIDLEKFFDRVNHDRLMSLLAKRISDKRVLKLIRAFLNAGIMENGVVVETKEGTPQGSPLSPLLSNIVLDELDKELERCGLHFVRFADDCVIYVKSKRAGDRVMESVSRFITRKLRLKVNEAKSNVGQPGYSKYLGFGFTISKTNPRIRIHSKSLKRFRERVVEITTRTRGRSMAQVVTELNVFVRGWWGYFRLCETRSCLRALNAWIIRRLRAYIWKQWKLPKTRVRELMARGIPEKWAKVVGNTRKGPWRLGANSTVAKALPVSYFTRTLGVVLPG
jgi:RNA-directed DNA polymerase